MPRWFRLEKVSARASSSEFEMHDDATTDDINNAALDCIETSFRIMEIDGPNGKLIGEIPGA